MYKTLVVLFSGLALRFSFAFLTDQLQHTTNNNDMLSNVLELMVDEKNTRHELQQIVTDMKHEMDGLKQGYERNLTQLKQEMDGLKQGYERNSTQVKQVIEGYAKNITEMKHEMNGLKQRYERNLTQLKQELEELKQAYAMNQTEMTHEIVQLKVDNTRFDQQQQEFTRNLTDLEIKLNTKPVIGFTARLGVSAPFTGIIKFENIISNNGNGYNNVTGNFTCDVPGLYAFFLNILSSTYGVITGIYKNRLELSAAYASHEQYGYTQGGVSTVIKLNKGDTVYVKSKGPYHFYDPSSFSGVLISN